MEDRIARLERKYSALKTNVEGLHAVRVDTDRRIGSMTSDISSIAGTVASVG